jgi:hypothetical protein
MGWSLGFDDRWNRDIGYGVPATCDHPGCNEKIDRGLAYVCGGEPFGGGHGCGLYFCGNHLWHRHPRGEDRFYQNCRRCMTYKPPFKPKPDHPEWAEWKLADDSWQKWRDENPDEVAKVRAALALATGEGAAP